MTTETLPQKIYNKPKTFIDEIPNTVNNRRFQQHLDLEHNERIILSGKFGSGKTYFLNQFFEDKENYNVFHLYPVNYQIASNKDIIELLKYDILFKIIDNCWAQKTEAISKTLASQFFLMNQKPNEILNLMKSICFKPTIKAGIETSKPIISFLTNFSKYYKEINKTEEEAIYEFASKLESENGGLYEFDKVSQLISSTLTNIRDYDKENILIIDDLDRIDPEHIFRLLNVFSSQVDNNSQFENSNKYGFDKIIFVCDLNNIREIYKHKYGENVDFCGYIEKFNSLGVFEYNLIDMQYNTIREIINYIVFLDKNYDYRLLSPYITMIIDSFIRLKLINIRDIERIIKTYDYNIGQEPFSKKEFDGMFMIIPNVFEIITFMIGDKKKLINYILKSSDDYNLENIFYDKHIKEDLLAEALLFKVFLDTNKLEKVNIISYEELSIEIHYEKQNQVFLKGRIVNVWKSIEPKPIGNYEENVLSHIEYMTSNKYIFKLLSKIYGDYELKI